MAMQIECSITKCDYNAGERCASNDIVLEVYGNMLVLRHCDGRPDLADPFPVEDYNYDELPFA